MLLSTNVALLRIKDLEFLVLFDNFMECENRIEFDTDKHHYVFATRKSSLELFSNLMNVIDLRECKLMSKEDIKC